MSSSFKSHRSQSLVNIVIIFESRKIFMGNLPRHLTPRDLQDDFAKFGTITVCNLKTNPDGTIRGFGFIELRETKEVNVVLSHFGKNLKITMEPARNKVNKLFNPERNPKNPKFWNFKGISDEPWSQICKIFVQSEISGVDVSFFDSNQRSTTTRVWNQPLALLKVNPNLNLSEILSKISEFFQNVIPNSISSPSQSLGTKVK